MNGAGFLWQTLRRGWWVILLTAGSAAAVALWMSAGQPRLHQAVVELAATPNSSVDNDEDLLDSIDRLDRRSLIATLAKVPTLPAVKRRAAERLQMGESEAGRYRVATRLEPHTYIVRLEVTGPEARRAEVLADSIAWVSRRESHGLYRLFSLRPLAAAQSSEMGTVEPVRNLMVGAVLGLFLGTVGAMTWTARRFRGGV